jgi:threonine/homoserine/homoserine lactone efflux protein
VIELAALLAWSALALIVTLTPGPDTLLVASHAARSGFRAGMAALAGIMTAVVFWYGSLIAFGVLSVLVAVPALFLAVKIAGALYLAWLGVGMIWNAIVPPASSRQGDAAGKMPAVLGQPFAQGFFTNALNPKVALFYLAALPQFASGPNAPMIGVMLLGIHALFGLVWLSFIAFAAARARAIVWNRTLARWLEGAVGVFFVGVAGRLALAQR